MIRETTKNLLNKCVNEEIENAMKYPLYRNENEYLGVIYEEIKEVEDEYFALKENMINMFECIRKKDYIEINRYSELIKNRSEKLALEAIQVSAVCNKWQKSFEEINDSKQE